MNSVPEARTGPTCLIVGSFGHGNVGDEAVYPAMSDIAASRGLDIRIQPVSRFDEVDLPEVLSRKALDAAADQYRGMPVIYAGGGVIEPRRRCVLLAMDDVIRRLRPRSVSAFGVAIEPGVEFPLKWRWRIKRAMRGFDHVSARDVISASVCEEGLRMRRPPVSGDVVLALRPSEAIGPDLRLPERYIAVNLAPRWPQHQDWWDLLAVELCAAARTLDARLVFVPMSVERDSDSIHHQAVLDRVPDLAVRREAVVVSRNLGPRVTLQVFAQATYAVAMRLHAVVMAASAHVPLTALPYHPKVAAFAKTCGLSDCVPKPFQTLGQSRVSTGYAEPPEMMRSGWLNDSIARSMPVLFDGVDQYRQNVATSFLQVLENAGFKGPPDESTMPDPRTDAAHGQSGLSPGVGLRGR